MGFEDSAYNLKEWKQFLNLFCIFIILFINFVQTFLDGEIHKDRASPKQSLLRWPNIHMQMQEHPNKKH